MTAPSNRPCSFPGCTDPRRVTRSGASEYPYCYRHNVAFERQRHIGIREGMGTYNRARFEREIAAGTLSVDELCSKTFGKHDATYKRQKPVALNQIMERVRALPPAPERSDLLSYTSYVKQTNWADYRLKCAFWRKRVDVWLLLNGAYRPLRKMDDSARATATARLAVLMVAEGSEAA